MKKLVDQLRARWQAWTGEEDTPFDGDAGAWIVSFFAHLGILVVLALIVLVVRDPRITLTVSMETKEEEEEVLKDIEEVYFSEETQEEIGAMSVNGAAMAEASAPVFSTESFIANPEIPQIEVPNATVALTSFDVSTGPKNNGLLVKGGVGEGSTGAPGAVDRITYEILESLAVRKTLVVWLFDQSGSLSQQRKDIFDRFDRIYHELGVLEDRNHKSFKKYAPGDEPLLSTIMAFGNDVKFLTDPKKPTAEIAVMKDAISKIENDPTGVERTFAAIKMAGQQHLHYRQDRNIMLVVVSDEIGDDEAGIEDALGVVRRYQMPVYVIGIPAPFGRREGKVRFVNHDPQYETSEYWIDVLQGPESFMPEAIRLDFWGDNRQREEADFIDSGFGPFSLTRLTYETGGIYFSVHPNRTREGRAMNRRDIPEYASLLHKFWDPGVMRPYAPDYISPQEYQQLLNSNKARMALVQTAMKSHVDAMGNPPLKFVKGNDADFGKDTLDAQKLAAVLEPRLQDLYNTLQVGEADRANVTQPRWQAGYDLAMGRVMAHRVRTEGYNLMLAEIKAGKRFEGEKNNTWLLRHSDTITTGSSHERMAKQAKTYLERVVNDHKGTPWAYLAAKELETPMGWQWGEEFTDVSPRMENAGNGNANPTPAQMMQRKRPAPRPKL